ncbi:NAD(P)H-dependent oxidoreductase [bacterium]|nr:NAD(P)H-dependent oxidoreductase [bacterium]
MKIVILNGSPKGELSITLQYVHYLEIQFPQHQFQVFHVAERIKVLEKNKTEFNTVVEAVRNSDAVLWSFGLWVLLVSAQYIRFIELIYERGVDDIFAGKYSAALSTSINYFDHTAHNYMRAVCEDLKMRFVDGISFDMMDLTKENKRLNLITFFQTLINSIERGSRTSTLFERPSENQFTYQPASSDPTVDQRGKKILLLTDESDKDANLAKMTSRFSELFLQDINIIDLSDIDIRGACLGCMKCGYNYQCQYKDGFSNFYNDTVRNADIIVIAGQIKNRFLSSKWKTFFDRAFFWNHTPSLENKQIAYLVSGSIRQNQNLVQFFEASVTARQNANLVDIISDESGDSGIIDDQLANLAQRLVFFSQVGHIKPQNFLAIGGHKIFRDNVWGRLRGIWQADHRFYKRSGYYDFPQKYWLKRIQSAILITLTAIPGFRKKFYNNLKKFPAMRFGKLIEKLGIESHLRPIPENGKYSKHLKN